MICPRCRIMLNHTTRVVGTTKSGSIKTEASGYCPGCGTSVVKHYYSKGDNKLAPNPGSDEALKLGCTCAVMDNCHGRGAFDFGPGNFWISENCPLHGGHISWPGGRSKENDK